MLQSYLKNKENKKKNKNKKLIFATSKLRRDD